MSYESPIKIIMDQMQTKYEDGIFEAIQGYAVDVDKDELIKALQYDRDQYEKGFEDGAKALAKQLLDNMYYNSFGEGVIFDNEIIGIMKDMGIKRYEQF